MATDEWRVLVLEDDDVDAQLIERELRKLAVPCAVTVVDDEESFQASLTDFNPTVVLADYHLPTFDGLSALAIVRETCPDLPFIFVSGAVGEEFAIQALQAGATDYVLKSRLSRISPAVQRAVREYLEVLHGRQVDEELQVAQLRLRQAVTAANLGLWEWDIEANHIHCDTPWGWLQEQLTGHVMDDLARLVPAEDFKQLRDDVATHLRAPGTDFMSQFRLPDDQGDWRWIKTRGRVVGYNSDGTPSRMTGTHEDVTAHKEFEQALKEARRAAEEANRSKSEFLANMSHEIRTPMNAVIGFADLLISTTLSADQRDYVRLIRESAGSLLEILNDILDFSKIEADKLQLAAKPFLLREEVEKSAHTLAVLAGQKGLELICHVPPCVPDHVVGDAGRLRQVLVNLIGNAVKFTDRGEVRIRCERRNETTDSVELLFEVSDTGIGIEGDHQSDILEPFRQADASNTRRFGGSGLGLAISERLVRMMGGKLWFKSIAGKGSTFSFTITCGRPSETPAMPDLPVIDIRNERVLVVDDNELNRRILDEYLNSWGLAPVLAASAAEGLRLLDAAAAAGDPIPLAIVDHQMPEMDGLQMVRILREDEHLGCRFIMLSSTMDLEGAQRDAIGASAYLCKPVRQSQLLDAIYESFAIGDGPTPGHEIPKFDVSRPRYILVAEDNPVNQKLVLRLLEGWGHRVDTVGDGLQALAKLRQNPSYDLVLMDVQMPVMDGLTAVHELRQMEGMADLPVIALTAHAMSGDAERFVAAGMSDYLPKPFSAHALFAKIEGITPQPLEALQGNSRVFDPGVTLQRLGGLEELMSGMIDDFLNSVDSYRQAIRGAIEAENSEDLRDQAHKLKGAAAFLEALDTVDSARALEFCGRDNDIASARKEFARLERQLKILCSRLREHRCSC
jgi:two-component system sensor histidine kinase/response regulator